MATSPTHLAGPTTIGSSTSILFQAVAVTWIHKITLLNYSGAVRSVSLYFVPSGQTPITGNLVVQDKQLNIGEAWEAWMLEGHVLGVDDTIRGVADAGNAISILLSGSLFT